jgi:DNA-binding CsgD family transcriptional regulator
MAKISATVGTRGSPGVVGATPVGSLQKQPETALLEREDTLATLNAAIADAVQGQGRCVLVAGEAGIGKSAVVGRIARQNSTRVRAFVAHCEAMFTPRPLGPLVDLAERLPPSLGQALHAGHTYNGLFPAFLDWLRRTTTLLVFEDLHWADAATLDLVRYIGRRVEGAGVALVLTYRDDELALAHPLRQVLGSLPGTSTQRIMLAPLSEDAVLRMARRAGRSPHDLYRVTGGNPFFVTEVLAGDGRDVPLSVRDAVLARLGGLTPAGRALAQQASVVPHPIERSLLEQLHGAGTIAIDGSLDECLERGVLIGDGGALRFRHELARVCIEQSLSPERRRALHAQVFATLGRRADATSQLARRVHHAEQAGLVDAVVELAPQAAREAADASAHRDAAALYGLALRHAERLAPQALAAILEARAVECALIQSLDDAAAARERALELHRASGDRRAQAWNLSRLASLRITRPEALDYAQQAIELLEQMLPGRELAWACADMAGVLTVRARATEALHWGRRALTLAEQVADPEALAYALNMCGSVELSLKYEEAALAKLERSLAIARQHGLDHKVALAYVNLAGMALVNHDYRRLLVYAEQGLAFALGRDLDFIVAALYLRRLFGWFDVGRWSDAAQELERLDAMPSLLPRERNTVRFLWARLRALIGTRNDADEWEELRAIGIAAQTEMRPASVASLCAEAAWLRGDGDATEQIITAALPHAIESGEPSQLGALLVWLPRCGAELPPLRTAIALPFRFEIEGQWQAAASAWAELGCVYESALALLGGDEGALRTALERFESLGAGPAADIARRRLRKLGASGLRRGPYEHARHHAFGFTKRENDVAKLLSLGLSNAAIADRLHRSERTVEHHVANVLAKLGVTSRAQAMLKLSNLRQTAEN